MVSMEDTKKPTAYSERRKKSNHYIPYLYKPYLKATREFDTENFSLQKFSSK